MEKRKVYVSMYMTCPHDLSNERLQLRNNEILTTDHSGHCHSPRLPRVHTLQQQSDPSPKAVRNEIDYDHPANV